MGMGEPAGKVGANGQPWEAERPTSYEGMEASLGSGRFVGGAFRSTLPCSLAPGAPHSHCTPHQAGEKRCRCSAIPKSSGRIELGKEEFAIPLLSISALEFSLHTPSDLDLGSGGRLSWKRFPSLKLRPPGAP